MSPKFSPRTVDTLGRRAAFLCSNPDCGAITVGAQSEAHGASVLGEAAHIFGAKPGSARFHSEMTDEERAFIENGIWLCRSCHKLVDDNPTYYTPELLIEWKAEHEGVTARELGTRGARLWRNARQKSLHPYRNLSTRAQEIIAEKPDLWEYKLILELIRDFCGPQIKRMEDVGKGIYVAKSERIEGERVIGWALLRLDEIKNLSNALFQIINFEIELSWGAPGVAGEVSDIVRTCRLLERVSAQLIEWEAEIRAVSVPIEFAPLCESLEGAGATLIQAIEKLIEFFEGLFSSGEPEGRYVFDFEVLLPEGWVERVNHAMETCSQAYLASRD